jgi:hypothetical protein
MKLSLKILESNKDIYSSILNALLPMIEDFMEKSSLKIKKEIPLVVQNSILNSPEYSALVAGQLRYEFGIPDASAKINNLLNHWINNMDVNYTKPMISNNKIKSSFSINMINADFSDILYKDFSFVIDNKNGYSLPWLRWLLLEGKAILVSKYEVVFGPNKNSRTGFAVMTPSTRSWKVPSIYSGTESDNWITRSIDSAKDQIYSILEKSLS